MIAWTAYAMLVALLLGVAALAAERAARLRGAATRWVWAFALAASLLLPAVMSSVSVRLPAALAPSAASAPVALRETASLQLVRFAPSALAAAAPAAAAASTSYDPLIRRAWAALSAAMLILLAAVCAVLHLRKRRWPQRSIAGTQVWLAPDAGPAVVGLLRPRIVVPAWLAAAPPLRQALVIAHEKSHIEAHDPQLLSAALALLVLMPWNLPLWWQLRRLRHAIEVDCDARVLRAGHALQDYGAALIDVGQRQSGLFGAVAAMAQSRSLLEQRIRIMVQAPARRGKALAATLAGMALCMVAVAAQVAPPPVDAGPVERHQIAMPASRLVDYEGTYQIDEFMLMTVTREGRRLWTQINGQPRIEQYPERQDGFFSRDIDAQIRFQRDGRGRVGALTLQLSGAEYHAPLLDKEARAAVALRINQNAVRTRPRPATEPALRRNLDLLLEGKVRLEDLTPQFGQQVLRAMPAITKDLARSGKMRSLSFLAVDHKGWDIYRVQHEQGVRDWYVLVNSDGKVAQAFSKEVF